MWEISVKATVQFSFLKRMIRDSADGNAIKAASTPNLSKLFSENPFTTIGASGLDVGLPDGQMGNSEVGH